MSSVLDLARPELLRLKPYSSARMEAGPAAVMLNANESPYPPYAGDSLGLNRYPEPQPAGLLASLAALYGVDPTQIFLGRGSDEAIDLLVRAFCRAGADAVLTTPPTFGMYAVAAGVQGAGVVTVALDAARDFAPDFDAILAAACSQPVKLVFICSPNNPTGGGVEREGVLRLLRALQGRALVIVDEAYAEYSRQPSLVSELGAHPNLGVLRTLSKAYGLAGARLGVLLAEPDVIGLLRRIMPPYPVPTPCAAAALAALQPQAQAERRSHVAEVIGERERLAQALPGVACVRRIWPSEANFLAFEVDDADRRWQQLGQAGIVVRNISHYPGLAQCLRVSVGLPCENQRFLEVLSGSETEGT